MNELELLAVKLTDIFNQVITETATKRSGTEVTTEVNNAISNLIGGSPAALDTLNKLATALGDDPNFSTTVTNSLAGKLPLSGGVMTGDIQMLANAIKFASGIHTIRDVLGTLEISSDDVIRILSGANEVEFVNSIIGLSGANGYLNYTAASGLTTSVSFIPATNNNQVLSFPNGSGILAVKTDISTAISNLVNSSPAALDTLNELAAALGDDPNFATTVNNSLAGKLPLSGGDMHGDINLKYSKLISAAELYLAPGNGIIALIESPGNVLFQDVTGVSGSKQAVWQNKNITVAGLDDIKNNYFFACSDEDSDLTVDAVNAVYTDYIPYAITVSSLMISANTAPTDDDIIVDIKKNGTSIFSTPIQIDETDNTSLTSLTHYVLTGAISFSKGDKIEAFITQVGSSVAGAGLKVKILD